MNWYLKCLKQYADFKGRARRKEYWLFFLFNILISFLLGLIDGLLGWADTEMGIGLLGGLYSLGVLVPGVAVCVRRLHDVGKSGWNYLLVLIPIAGAIVLLVWFCTEGEKGSNEWGENPKLIVN